MTSAQHPDWYTPGDIPKSIQQGLRQNIAAREIVDHLATADLDAPRDRIHEMVTTAQDRIPASDETAPEPLEEPRTLEARYVDVSDVEYLTPTQFGTLVGVILTRYEGTFRTPDPIDDLAVHLFWNQQHATVAFRTLPRPPDTPIDRPDITPLIEDETAPPSGRSPSRYCLVTNTGFTDSAISSAKEEDIDLFGRTELSDWFDATKLTRDVFGTLLETDDLSPEEYQELTAQLEPLPEVIHAQDPLERTSDKPWSSTDDGGSIQPGIDRTIPVADTNPSPGQAGRLYANPSDDGDYGAFDRFKDQLDTESQ